jgi:hypothetical protein
MANNPLTNDKRQSIAPFVALAVLTTTADGTLEETKIESKQADAINKHNSHKPLFEKLRQNQEEEEAKEEDVQRQMMRGTMALDDEDVAHRALGCY